MECGAILVYESGKVRRDRREDLASPEVRAGAPYAVAGKVPLVDEWLFGRLAETIQTVNEALAGYRFHEAAQGIYQFFWGDFCDWYIEWVKPELQNADRERATVAWKNLFAAFDAALRLLHPIMPFLTEELWHQLPQASGAKSIALDMFPEANPKQLGALAEKGFLILKRVIESVRICRVDSKLDPKKKLAAELSSQDIVVRKLFEENAETIKRLAVLSNLHVTPDKPGGQGYFHSTRDFDLHIPFEEVVDPQAEVARLNKEVEGLQKAVISKEKQLASEMFRSRAPANIIAALEVTLAEQRLELKKLQDRLSQLG
jgi:valyl-tRNA synthetase